MTGFPPKTCPSGRTWHELCIERGAYDVYIVDTEERKESVWSAAGISGGNQGFYH